MVVTHTITLDCAHPDGSRYTSRNFASHVTLASTPRDQSQTQRILVLHTSMIIFGGASQSLLHTSISEIFLDAVRWHTEGY